MNIIDYDSMLKSLEDRPARPEYAEILKLDEMLTRAGIEHSKERLFDGWILRNESGVAIEHLSSFGYWKDRVEIAGFGLQDPRGSLTAEQAMKWFRKGAKQ